MPRFCKCGRITKQTPCDQCAKHADKGSRAGTAAERGYDYAWTQLSKRYRARHPLCEDCEESGSIPVREAEEVHHLTPIRDDPSKRLDWSNLRALCGACHDARHRQGRRQEVSSHVHD